MPIDTELGKIIPNGKVEPNRVGRPPIQIDLEELDKRISEGLTFGQIAKAMDKSYAIIYKVCKDNGFVVKKGKRGRPKKI